ncbi:MAG: acetyl-CoA carboxylase biotin carboxyl carrier protein subunit [Bacillaceae bacterium]
MAGNVWKILVDVGDRIYEEEDVVILESMKMEIFVSSYEDGEIVNIFVKEGDFVNEGDQLVEIK